MKYPYHIIKVYFIQNDIAISNDIDVCMRSGGNNISSGILVSHKRSRVNQSIVTKLHSLTSIVATGAVHTRGHLVKTGTSFDNL